MTNKIKCILTHLACNRWDNNLKRQTKLKDQQTCIDKYLHVHHVTDTWFMKNQYTLQDDYFRCIDLPKVSSSIITNDKHLPIFSFYMYTTPPIIFFKTASYLVSMIIMIHDEERVSSFKTDLDPLLLLPHFLPRVEREIGTGVTKK